MKPILIVGLGNPLRGDDGAGCRVAEALTNFDLPEQVEVVDAGAPGVGLINLLEGRQRAILVDAAEMGLPPGSLVRFSPDEVLLEGQGGERFSLHHAGVAEALELAQALGLALPEIVLWGIQPERVDWTPSLSPRVQAVVEEAARAVLQEVGPHDGTVS